MKKANQTNEAETARPKAPRDSIALFITISVISITIIIAIISIIVSPTGENGARDLSFVGQTLLPLWSTWIGTVLAFYFGKANFEAATKSVQDAMKTLTPEEKIAKLMVKDVMLPIKDLIYLDFDVEAPKLLNEILKYPQFEPYKRFAVLDKNKVVKYMVHRSTFYQFMYRIYSDQKASGLVPDTDTLTLNDLLNTTDEKIRATLNRGIGFISLDANLLDAKRVIDATEECQDVFVTQNGKSSEPVLGLVTNNRIFGYAKV